MPEVSHSHSLCEIAEAECGGQGQRAGNVIGHFRGLFEGNDHSHVQREKDGHTSYDQKNRYRPVNSVIHYFFLHHNCSSFLFNTVIWNTEIATITTKKSTALALWNPNCPPPIPF